MGMETFVTGLQPWLVTVQISSTFVLEAVTVLVGVTTTG